MYQNTIIIPALNPPEQLISYVTELINKGFDRILLIDDGSDENKRYIFDSLNRFDEVTIFRHGVNLGKGRSLKNAFNYILAYWEDSAKGVITVDSDGQHTIEDIIKLHNMLEIQKEPVLILGTRDFDEREIPFKSRYGNKVTSLVFRILYGIKIDDTQTGLRAISKEYLYDYCTLRGEHFEYEMNMLIYAALHKIKIIPCFIKTVYFDNNSETHFRPFVDSLRIYGVILKGFFTYILSSVSAAGIDLVLFKLFLVILGELNLFSKIICSTIIARIFSSVWNFMINRKLVFQSTGKVLQQAGKYYILCIFEMFFSAIGVSAIHYIISWDEMIEKVIVDSILFLFSYQIQQLWVFREH